MWGGGERAHVAPPKTQVLEKGTRTRKRGASIKSPRALHKRENCYAVCKRATPTPKTNRNSNVGDYGSAQANCSACSERGKQLAKTPAGFQLANAALSAILPQDFF